jgi:hypothetical protein
MCVVVHTCNLRTQKAEAGELFHHPNRKPRPLGVILHFLLPQPLAPTILLLWTCLVWIIHIN